MKTTLAVAVLLALGSFGSGAMAQTCESPMAQPGVGAAGDTCDGANIIGTYCGFFSHAGEEVVYLVELPAAGPLTVQPAAGFDVAITLIPTSDPANSNDCLVASNCVTGAPIDDAGPGGAETTPIAGLNGMHYMVVSSTVDPVGQNTCGGFTVVSFPVELQSFTID